MNVYRIDRDLQTNVGLLYQLHGIKSFSKNSLLSWNLQLYYCFPKGSPFGPVFNQWNQLYSFTYCTSMFHFKVIIKSRLCLKSGSEHNFVRISAIRGTFSAFIIHSDLITLNVLSNMVLKKVMLRMARLIRHKCR